MSIEIGRRLHCFLMQFSEASNIVCFLGFVLIIVVGYEDDLVLRMSHFIHLSMDLNAAFTSIQWLWPCTSIEWEK